MTLHEAKSLITRYYTSVVHTEEDKFLFEEAQHFLIDTYHDPNDMHNLAWYYFEDRQFDLYQKYLELAAEYGYSPSYESLGYLWYYGQTGTVDYKKAFEYFSKGAESPDDYLRMGCEYKLADMYHNGYYVEKDEAKYREIIERCYDLIQHPERIRTIIPTEFLPNPSISYRLAGVRADDGRLDEAMELLKEAKIQYAEYLKSNPYWWGNVEEMEMVIMKMHDLLPESSKRIDLYDLFWIAKQECKIVFEYQDRRFVIECIEEDGEIVIKFDYKWYRNPRSFLEKAKIDENHITTLYDELYDFEVHYG